MFDNFNQARWKLLPAHHKYAIAVVLLDFPSFSNVVAATGMTSFDAQNALFHLVDTGVLDGYGKFKENHGVWALIPTVHCSQVEFYNVLIRALRDSDIDE